VAYTISQILLTNFNQIFDKMKNNFSKICIIFSVVFFASCAAKEEQQTKIRIVDLQGKPRSVITKTPEFNNQALAAQDAAAQGSQNNMVQNLPPQNSDFGAVQSQDLQRTVQNPSVAPTYSLVKDGGKKSSNVDDSMTAAGAPAEQAIEYDLSESEKTVPEKKSPSKKSGKKMKLVSGQEKSSISSTTATAKNTIKTQGIFVQVGSFASAENADKSLAAMSKFHKGKIETSESGDKEIHRVLLGPFSTKQKASIVVNKIKSSGHDAIIVRNK